ncbi:quinolinate synthase NadA [Candidatus Margulisiibacteriota bacterium]
MLQEINRLKKEKNAVILVHNYQLPEVQDIGDFTGDSLGLSLEAAKTDADVIVFCGVYFMAETAKILSPQKTVLIPEATAGCPMADMITAEKLRELKKEKPNATVVCYVNTTAEVKAESDYCCTSANAEKMVKTLLAEGKEIVFVPDKNLSGYISDITQKEFTIWPGFCPSHVKILPEHIEAQKEKYPNAEVIVHPECNRTVRQMADKVLSTSGMLKYASSSLAKEFIVGTEVGMLYPLQKENPGKKFYPATELALCPNMKKTNLEKVLWCLREMKHEVTLTEDIRLKAQTSIKRMLEYTA